MRFTAYRCPKTPEVWNALVKTYGANDVPASSLLERKSVAIVGGLEYGSDSLLRDARTTGHPYVFVDAGYLHSKVEQKRIRFRMVPNGFTHYWVNPNRANDRARAEVMGLTPQPWKQGGRDILVCTSASKHHWFFGLESWVSETIAALKKVTDRPIILRRHEDAASGGALPLHAALRTAHAVVTHTSTVAIEAVLLGAPVFVAPENAAAPVGNTDLAQIEAPKRPDRDAWANSLAWGQFETGEIFSGLARSIVKEWEWCRPDPVSKDWLKGVPGFRDTAMRPCAHDWLKV